MLEVVTSVLLLLLDIELEGWDMAMATDMGTLTVDVLYTGVVEFDVICCIIETGI
jgi:hypothetical protein